MANEPEACLSPQETISSQERILSRTRAEGTSARDRSSRSWGDVAYFCAGTFLTVVTVAPLAFSNRLDIATPETLHACNPRIRQF